MVEIGGGIKTAELMEEERKNRIAHAVTITEATLEVEQILIKRDLTWTDWEEVVKTINLRTQIVLDKMKIKQIKDRFEKHG